MPLSAGDIMPDLFSIQFTTLVNLILIHFNTFFIIEIISSGHKLVKLVKIYLILSEDPHVSVIHAMINNQTLSKSTKIVTLT